MTTGSDNRSGSLARFLQFGDSMFPIGGFSFSCGLESAVQTGVVDDRATLHAFARTALEQAARGDGIALIAAHRAAMGSDVAGGVGGPRPSGGAGLPPQAAGGGGA